jgi:hypothetical protein
MVQRIAKRRLSRGCEYMHLLYKPFWEFPTCVYAVEGILISTYWWMTLCNKASS